MVPAPPLEQRIQHLSRDPQTQTQHASEASTRPTDDLSGTDLEPTESRHSSTYGSASQREDTRAVRPATQWQHDRVLDARVTKRNARGLTGHQTRAYSTLSSGPSGGVSNREKLRRHRVTLEHALEEIEGLHAEHTEMFAEAARMGEAEPPNRELNDWSERFRAAETRRERAERDIKAGETKAEIEKQTLERLYDNQGN